MKISVFGLGYVGVVTAGCLTEKGHSVVGVDVHTQKIEAINRGESPIIEPQLAGLLKSAREQGLLRATADAFGAIQDTDVSLICVGTPSAISGALDLRYVRQVTEEVAASLRKHPKKHILIFRSTMLPGSTQQLVRDYLLDLIQAGSLDVYYFPEFLREGSAVDDFRNPSLTVVGTAEHAPLPLDLAPLFGAGAVVVNWAAAEMVKYACNAFHALKITFANEVGRISKPLGIDAGAVMALVCQDKKLNISPYYLRPGNPFGGSCLPKDVRALTQCGRLLGLSLPMLESLLPSNDQHLRSLLQLVETSGHNEVVILGLSFKSNTDDLRESAMVDVAQHLLGRGCRVRIYDPQLNLAQLVGSNKRLIDIKMPHLASLLFDDLAAAIGARGLILAAQRCALLADLAKCVTPHHHVIDINGWPELKQLASTYEGFCW